MAAAILISLPWESDACSRPGDDFLFFASSSSALPPNAEEVIGRLKSATVDGPHSCFVVEVDAHLDEAEAATNPGLDRERVAAVVQEMQRQGLLVEIVERSHGASQPLVFNPRGAAEPQNRRVTLHRRLADGVASRRNGRTLGMGDCRLFEVFLPDGTSCGFWQ